MRRGLEESVTKCTDHLQLSVQVREVHVVEDIFNKEEIFGEVLHFFMFLLSIFMYMVMHAFH